MCVKSTRFMKTNSWRAFLRMLGGCVQSAFLVVSIINISPLLILLPFCAVSTLAQNVSFTVLHNFTNSPDGKMPVGCIIEGSDGAIYGATDSGGTNFSTLYKINKNGTGYTKLADLDINSYQPDGGLLKANDGLIYGTTTGYGIGAYATNDGTVFKMNGDGSGFSIPYAFVPNNSDALYPRGHLIQAVDGGLYGVSASGGVNGIGTIFRFDLTSGKPSVIYSCTNFYLFGNVTSAGLFQGIDGELYGTTFRGELALPRFGGQESCDCVS